MSFTNFVQINFRENTDESWDAGPFFKVFFTVDTNWSTISLREIGNFSEFKMLTGELVLGVQVTPDRRNPMIFSNFERLTQGNFMPKYLF